VTGRPRWLRRIGHGGIGLGDNLVAAPAEIEECELATLNDGHFPMFSDSESPF
jgi:predicted nucleic acid-binding protein